MRIHWFSSAVSLLLILSGCAGSAPGRANSDGWTYLGSRTVHGRNDRDRIRVGPSEGRFSEIRLAVSGSALEMRDVVVDFGADLTFSPPTRFHLRRGEKTRAITIPGGPRVIRAVRFHYGNMGRAKKATVELYGR